MNRALSFYYLLWAGFYERTMTESGEYNAHQVIKDVVESMDGIPKRPYIVDVAIGTGLTAAALKGHFVDATVLGLDGSQSMLDRCGTQHPDFALQRCNLDRRGWDVASDISDLTISTGAFEHFRNPEAVIGEMARVTKPGGVVIVDFECIREDVPGIVINLLTLCAGNLLGLTTRYHSMRSIRQAFKDGGLDVVEELDLHMNHQDFKHRHGIVVARKPIDGQKLQL